MESTTTLNELSMLGVLFIAKAKYMFNLERPVLLKEVGTHRLRISPAAALCWLVHIMPA